MTHYSSNLKGSIGELGLLIVEEVGVGHQAEEPSASSKVKKWSILHEHDYRIQMAHG